MKNLLLVFLIVLTNCTKKDTPEVVVKETLTVENAKLQISALNGNINALNFYYTDNGQQKTATLMRDDSKDGSMSAINDIISDNTNITASQTLNEFIALQPLNDGSFTINAGSDLSQTGGVKKIIINKITLLEARVESQAMVDHYIANPTAARNYARGLINQAKTRPFSLDLY